jgi:flavodoxin
MKVLVAYMSQTGNTRKVAEAIFGEIAGDKEIKRIQDVQSLDGYDISFLGFPMHGDKLEPKVAAQLSGLCIPGKKVAIFATHAGQEENNAHAQQWLAQLEQAASAATIVGTFNCQGQLAATIKFIMSIHPNAEYRRWAKMDSSHGQPDESRLEKARAFSRQVMKSLHNADAKSGGRIPVVSAA